ncbi:DNA repair protein RecO [Gracilibacillus halophilus YIM-C55.5]|uniref:DNA repair protein RecO n=1 Tax=Gracilibacillus halophilus YIM-C55.5 TaxID=1308866 RepID=N4WWQ8_9BACI|nr:DNA repair protein RecO [Gracilibacillus halophilus]ENH97501.1 DNA repair protein RecO [Gracilibacillus halophilus YIM-C55.5]
MFEKMDGFILKTHDYGETHKIVTLLTANAGKVGAIAKGAKKTKSRMAAITQPFIHGSYLIQLGSNLATLQQGEVISSFRSIREDIFKTAFVSYLAELTDKLIDDKQFNPKIYHQLLHTVQRIDQEADAQVLAMIYEWKMYKEAGFAPVIHQCVHCGKREQFAGFSIAEGGVLCRRCQSMDPHFTPLHEKLLKLLEVFDYVEMDQIGDISIKEENKHKLQAIMDRYYEYYGGYYMKTKRFLKQLDSLSTLND